jgi:hypothetical protein
MPGTNQAGTSVASGCTKVTKVLNAVNQEVTIWCAGQSKVGIGITNVTGASTLSFFGSIDGITFNPITVGAYPEAIPPVNGVTVVTAAGNYELPVQNYLFIRVQMTAGAGPATVIMAASVDSSYQEAFLVGQSSINLVSTLYPSTTSTAADANTMVIPGQANRMINLTFLEVSLVGSGFGGNAQLKIWDNAVLNGVPLYSCFLTSPIGSVGSVQKINLPQDAQGNIGVQGTPGNALVIQIRNLGNTSSIINARASMI